MKKLFILIMVLILVNIAFAEKLATLTDLAKPGFITIDKDQFFVNDGVATYIYSLKDHKLQTKFGKQGQGPGEFMVHPNINRGTVLMYLLPEAIVTNSFGKVAYFSREGKFIKELKSTIIPTNFCPLGKKYAGFGFTQLDGTQFFATAIYTSELKLEKELVKKKGFEAGKKMNAIAAVKFPRFYVNEQKIYAEGLGGKIHIFDQSGKELARIEHKFKKIEVTEEHKKRYLNFYKTDTRFKDSFAQFKAMFEFPDYFPAFRDFHLVGDKIYVLTYNGKEGNEEFLIFDNRGKYEKTLMISMVSANPTELYPYTFSNGKLYQILENEDEEDWELHASTVK